MSFFPELGEADPLLHKILNAVGAVLEDGKIVIPAKVVGDEAELRGRFARFYDGKWHLPIPTEDERIVNEIMER